MEENKKLFYQTKDTLVSNSSLVSNQPGFNTPVSQPRNEALQKSNFSIPRPNVRIPRTYV